MSDEKIEKAVLKPSIESLEGKSLAVIILSCLAILYDVLNNTQVLQTVIDTAQTTQSTLSGIDIAAMSTTELGKTGGILFFIYKLYSNFLEKRTELKKKELEG